MSAMVTGGGAGVAVGDAAAGPTAGAALDAVWVWAQAPEVNAASVRVARNSVWLSFMEVQSSPFECALLQLLRGGDNGRPRSATLRDGSLYLLLVCSGGIFVHFVMPSRLLKYHYKHSRDTCKCFTLFYFHLRQKVIWFSGEVEYSPRICLYSVLKKTLYEDLKG